MKRLSITVAVSGWIFMACYLTFEYFEYGGFSFFFKHLTSHSFYEVFFHIFVLIIAPISLTILGFSIDNSFRLQEGLKNRVEEFAKELQQELAEHKRTEETLVKLRKAVEASGEAIFMTDCEGILTYVNPEFTRLYGYDESEVVGRVTPRILKSGRMKPENYKMFWKAILNKEVLRGEIINKTKNGAFVIVDNSANPILDEQGNILGFLAIQRDITERKNFEHKLLQSQKMESIGIMAGGIAHDFNNILTSVVGYTELILSKLMPGDPLWNDFCKVKKECEHAAGLVRQILAFSRRQILEPRNINLNQVLSGIEEFLRRIVGESIELKIITDPLPATVYVDPVQFEQVLINLSLNARDAMPGGGKLLIEINNVDIDEDCCASHPEFHPGSYVQLAISDTGTGIDKEAIEHIFEPFFTTKEQGKGTGLGLAVVHGVVKQHGGFIFVSSVPGRGTTFEVYFKSVQGKAEKILINQPVAPRNGSETILLAEDEKVVRELVIRILEESGYKVLSASNGKEALQVFENYSGQIHLAMLDMVMPKMGGMQVYDLLHVQKPDLKFLFVSGYSAGGIHEEFILKEGMELLLKPFTPVELTRRLREVLDK
ncbi:MAG: ATP-binding protein [Firmicutes bacterium]|nr:ATP-binding protein [Bacillota bacterium]